MSIIAEVVNVAIHGQIGKQFIYWVVAGQQYKRPYKIPYDPKTFDQRTQRNKFYIASQMWNELTTEEKKEWKEKVKKTQYVMTGYNYFIREKIKEMKPMIKKITHGSATLSDGLNVIPIATIDLEKTVLHYNCYLGAIDSPVTIMRGITAAYFQDANNIYAQCADLPASGTVKIFYTIIEFI